MKKITLSLLACAVFAVGCSKNEVEQVNEKNGNTINFVTNTTKTSVNTLATLQGDGAGFTVYAASGANATAWYPGIDGANNYKFGGATWGWTNTPAPQWPTTSAGYPMQFYAFYPSSAPGITPIIVPGKGIGFDVNIPSLTTSQVDMLTAQVQTDNKPGNSLLPMTLKHILSKVNFGIIPGNASDVYVQSVKMNNVSNFNKYGMAFDPSITSGWQNQISGNGSYTYYGLNRPAIKYTGVSDETAVQPIYSGTHTNHLMLLPQTHTAWDKSPGLIGNGSLIEVVYRIESAGNVNNIGYQQAQNHPNYATTPSSPSLPGATTPLFIKVGFPVSVNWVEGKGYTYNIKLGTADATGGYYLDKFYIDENGNSTSFPIKDIMVGNPVSDGAINFNVSVTDWDDTTPATAN